MNFTPWQDVSIEPYVEMSLCFPCSENESISPQEWHWMHHIYSVDDRINCIYCINNKDSFKRFMDTTVDR